MFPTYKETFKIIFLAFSICNRSLYFLEIEVIIIFNIIRAKVCILKEKG